jgi:hypothetical protein
MADREDEQPPDVGEDDEPDELPDRLLIMTGFYAGCSLRLDRGPLVISDEEGCSMRLNPGYYRGARVIVNRVLTPIGTKRFEVFNVEKRAIFNGKVRATQFRPSHGDIIEIPPITPSQVTIRFKLAEEGQYIPEDSYPSWWYFTEDMHMWGKHPMFRQR